MAAPIRQKTSLHCADPDHVTVKRQRIDSSLVPTDRMKEEVELSRGAEGLVSTVPYLGRLAVRKKRFRKPYRHPELDAKLTSRRLSQEARILLRLRKAGIRVPALYVVDLKTSVLVLEYLPGTTLKAFLNQEPAEGRREAVMRDVGREVARMHKCEIVHGDLTTGNVMVLSRFWSSDGDIAPQKGEICMIDFGLSSGNGSEEDMAVDLYVLERAVISAHAEAAQPLNKYFLEAYALELQRPSVLKRLAEVRSRGRKRDMTG